MLIDPTSPLAFSSTLWFFVSSADPMLD